MRETLSARLSKLESKLTPNGIVVLCWDGLQDREECIRGAGYDPGDRRMTFILADPTDQRA